jgi:hypothetical protein
MLTTVLLHRPNCNPVITVVANRDTVNSRKTVQFSERDCKRNQWV